MLLVVLVGGWWLTGWADSWAWAHGTPWLAARPGGERALVGAAVGVAAGLPLVLLALPRLGRRLSAPPAVAIAAYGLLCAECWLGSWAVGGHGQTCDQPANWAQCDYASVAVPGTVTSAAGFAAVALTVAVLVRRLRRRPASRPAR